MTVYIEDLLLCLAGNSSHFMLPPVKVNRFDNRLVTSLASNVDLGKGMTEKQRNLVIKLCDKYKSQLASAFGNNVDAIINAGQFRLPLLAPSVQQSSIKIVDKKIEVIFPFNNEIVEKIRLYRSSIGLSMVRWNPDNKTWEFDLEESNVMWIQNNIVDKNFIVDPNFTELFEKISEIFSRLEDFVPQLAYDNDCFVFKNVHPSIPQPETSDLIKAILLARMYGITTWDENVEKMKENAKFSPLFETFLTKTEEKILEFDSNEFDIDQFTDLFAYNVPALIVIPGGSEFQSLRTWYFWLKSQNFEEKSISVMFRLDNGSGAAFNDIVKECKLNNPITEDTKVVFISQKLPKPVVKSGIDFKFILNLSATWSSHFSINQYLDTMPNVIRYAPKKKVENKIEFV